MNDVRRFSLRRAIASLLVAAECLSLAVVGVPVSYAEEQILTTGQTEQVVLSPGAEEETLTLDAGARAAEAARRALEIAGRAKEEADWAAEAASIAAEEAEQAEQQAEILASEAQFAEELAYQTAEEADRLREEADLRIERINEIRSTAEPIDKTNKAEEKKSDKPDTKGKGTELVEETSSSVAKALSFPTRSAFSLSSMSKS